MTSTEPATSAGRPTRQRRAIAAAMETFDDFRSAQEIHALLSEKGEQVGLSTVYRTLQALADAHEIDSLPLLGEEPVDLLGTAEVVEGLHRRGDRTTLPGRPASRGG